MRYAFVTTSLRLYAHLTITCIVLGGLLSSAPAQARDKLLNIQEVTSPGGITAWLVEDHSVPVIALKFAFRNTGAALDPAEKQGISRLLSNTLDEGAGELDSQAFQKEIKDKSIALSFASGRDHFAGNIKTLTKNKDRAFELMNLALTQPRFDEPAVNRMRLANQARIRSSLADPSWIAARQLNDRAFEGHPYAHNSGGTLSSLASITTDDLRTFKETLSRDRLVVTVSGDITADQLSGALDTLFSGLPETSTVSQPPPLELQNQGKVFLYKKDIPQTIVEILQPGIDRKDPDYHKAQIMNFILGGSGFGSRLTEEVREKRGLTYGIYSYFQDMNHIDLLAVSSSTRNESVEEMLRLIDVEWDRLRNEPISQQELDDAKSYLIGSLPLSLTSTNEIAGLMLSLRLNELPIDYLDQHEANINAVTIEDVQTIANKILDKDKFVTVLVGQPPASLKPTDILESIPNVE